VAAWAVAAAHAAALVAGAIAGHKHPQRQMKP